MEIGYILMEGFQMDHWKYDSIIFLSLSPFRTTQRIAKTLSFITEMGPCLDGDFFPEPLDLLRAKAAPKPLLNGVTKEEGLFLSERLRIFFTNTNTFILTSR